MLHVCADHGDDKDIGAIMASVLGIATIAMGEDIGASMALRCYDHLL